MPACPFNVKHRWKFCRSCALAANQRFSLTLQTGMPASATAWSIHQTTLPALSSSRRWHPLFVSASRRFTPAQRLASPVWAGENPHPAAQRQLCRCRAQHRQHRLCLVWLERCWNHADQARGAAI